MKRWIVACLIVGACASEGPISPSINLGDAAEKAANMCRFYVPTAILANTVTLAVEASGSTMKTIATSEAIASALCTYLTVIRATQ